MNLVFNPRYTAVAQNDPNMSEIDRVFSDDDFIVERHFMPDNPRYEFRLVVHRKDRATIGDWRTLQDAKNQSVGPERQAIQVFPPESQVTDTLNHYHLWVFSEGHGPGVGIETHEQHLARQRSRETEDAARESYFAMLGLPNSEE